MICLQAAMLTVCWWGAAIYVTVMIKLTTKSGEGDARVPPFMLTCMVNTTTGFISWLVSLLSWALCSSPDERPIPSASRFEKLQVLALGVMQGCEIGFINKALEYMSISERTMLSNCNVLVLMLTANMFGLERLSGLRALAGLLLVLGGVFQGIASGTEQQGPDPQEHIKGYVFMLSSMLLTSLKWSLIQFVTQRSSAESFLGKVTKFQLAALVQPTTGVVCLLLAIVFEWKDIANPGMWREQTHQLFRIPAIALGITMIMSSELKLVQLTSAVATAVLMNLHHIPMVLAGVLEFHDHIVAFNIYGFALNLMGGIVYALARKYDDSPAGAAH